MANSLFDLPSSRSNKGADKVIVTRATKRKSAPVVVRGDGLIEKISTINALVEKKLGKYKDEYEYIMDETVFNDYVDSIIENKICALDTETTGLDPLSDNIVGMSLYTPNKKAVYIPIHHESYITGLESEGQLSVDVIKKGLDKLNSSGVMIVFHNAKFDIRVIMNSIGVRLHAYFDTMIAANLLNENEPHGLKALHSKYVLNGKEDEFSFGKLFDDVVFSKVPIKTGYIYAARDAIDTYELYQFQLPFLTKGSQECTEQGLDKVCNVFWNIEMPFIDVLVDMEQTGVCIDTEYADKLSVEYHKREDEILKEFNKACDAYSDEITSYRVKNPNNKLGDPINIASPTQLAILLYDIMKLDAGVDKKTGKQIRGTGDDILEKLNNPVCEIVRKYRSVDKLIGTYIDKLPTCISSKDNRLHCNFNQYGAKTGRLSSDNPNLQNIPSHNHDIRKMFVASPGYIMLGADFSQQEPRCMAAMCGDPIMIQAYKDGKDLYAQIASLSFNKPYEECLEFRPDGTTNPEGKARRSSAKTILLGILYGRGIDSVAEQLHTTKQKAQQIQDKIFKGFPAIKQFEDDTIQMAEDIGFVTTFWGRKRRLPEMQLPEFEFKWKPGYGDEDPLSFDGNTVEDEVPIERQKYYIRKLHQNPYKKRKIFEEANNEGIWITDNGGVIADATRQCVNARIQGSAADMSKIAGRLINTNPRLKELGFRLLIPIHDEYLAECPVENAKECAKIFTDCMCQAAHDLGIPISCDATVSYRWYGDEVNLEDL